MSQVSNHDCRQRRDEQLIPSDAISWVRKGASALIHCSVFCTQNLQLCALDKLLLCGLGTGTAGGSPNTPGLVGHSKYVDRQLGRYSSSYHSNMNFTINLQIVSVPAP